VVQHLNHHPGPHPHPDRHPARFKEFTPHFNDFVEDEPELFDVETQLTSRWFHQIRVVEDACVQKVRGAMHVCVCMSNPHHLPTSTHDKVYDKGDRVAVNFIQGGQEAPRDEVPNPRIWLTYPDRDRRCP
jgi:hypothetical protein